MKEAARAAARGRIFKCDLGRLNNDIYFTYVAAFGIFTETSYETPQDMKNMLGHMAYVLQGVMDLGKIRTYHFSVETDELSISDEFVFGMITNSKSVGGIMDITGSRVDMSDGLFEVTLIKMPTNILELGEIVQYLNRVIDTSDFVYQFKTSHIIMESPEMVKWTKDGEYGGSYKRIDEEQKQRAWTAEEIERMLMQAGFDRIAVYGNGHLNPAREKEDRWHFAAMRRVQPEEM